MVLFVSLSAIADKSPAASWPFDQGKGPDRIQGYHKFVPGIAGTGLRFDGQTTSVVRAARFEQHQLNVIHLIGKVTHIWKNLIGDDIGGGSQAKSRWRNYQFKFLHDAFQPLL